MSGNVFKSKEGKFRLDVRKELFTQRVVRRWHRLFRGVVLGGIQCQGGWDPGQPDLGGGNQPMAGGLDADDL